jgi:hypothetical protein
MARNWRELFCLAVFVLLFGAAMVANVSDSSLSQVPMFRAVADLFHTGGGFLLRCN